MTLKAALLLCTFLFGGFFWTAPLSPAPPELPAQLHKSSSAPAAVTADALQFIRSKDGLCPPHCHECYVGMSPKHSCKMCKHKYYLLDGTCVRSCPKSRRASGKGFYDRKCLFPDASASKDAHAHSAQDSERPVRRGKSESQGRIESHHAAAASARTASARITAHGSHNDVRQAHPSTEGVVAAGDMMSYQQPAPQTSATPPALASCSLPNCLRCNATGLCIRCRPSYVVRNGTCVSSCQSADSKSGCFFSSAPPPQPATPLRRVQAAFVSTSTSGLHAWRHVLEQPVQPSGAEGLYRGQAVFGRLMLTFYSGPRLEPAVLPTLTHHSRMLLALDLTTRDGHAASEVGERARQWLEAATALPGTSVGLMVTTDACVTELPAALQPYLPRLAFLLLARTLPVPASVTSVIARSHSWMAGTRQRELDNPRVLSSDAWPSLPRPHFCHLDGPVQPQSPVARALLLVGEDARVCVQTDPVDMGATMDALKNSDYKLVHAANALQLEQQIYEALEAGAVPMVVREQHQGCADLLSSFSSAPFLWVEKWSDLHHAIARAPSSLNNQAQMAAARGKLRSWLAAQKTARRSLLMSLLQD